MPYTVKKEKRWDSSGILHVIIYPISAISAFLNYIILEPIIKIFPTLVSYDLPYSAYYLVPGIIFLIFIGQTVKILRYYHLIPIFLLFIYAFIIFALFDETNLTGYFRKNLVVYKHELIRIPGGVFYHTPNISLESYMPSSFTEKVIDSIQKKTCQFAKLDAKSADQMWKHTFSKLVPQQNIEIIAIFRMESPFSYYLDFCKLAIKPPIARL